MKTVLLVASHSGHYEFAGLGAPGAGHYRVLDLSTFNDPKGRYRFRGDVPGNLIDISRIHTDGRPLWGTGSGGLWRKLNACRRLVRQLLERLEPDSYGAVVLLNDGLLERHLVTHLQRNRRIPILFVQDGLFISNNANWRNVRSWPQAWFALRCHGRIGASWLAHLLGVSHLVPGYYASLAVNEVYCWNQAQAIKRIKYFPWTHRDRRNYIRPFRLPASTERLPSANRILFFATNLDEPAWAKAQRNQIGEAADICRDRGYTLVVRLHPGQCDREEIIQLCHERAVQVMTADMESLAQALSSASFCIVNFSGTWLEALHLECPAIRYVAHFRKLVPFVWDRSDDVIPDAASAAELAAWLDTLGSPAGRAEQLRCFRSSPWASPAAGTHPLQMIYQQYCA